MNTELVFRVHLDATHELAVENGVAIVSDGSTGSAYSVHPCIHETGSVEGMIACGAWGPDDHVVRAHGFLYNVSRKFEVDPKNAWESIAAYHDQHWQ